ncbi:MAG: TOBE domain-containing protein, partial [Gammaproteobacteria bacterium]
SISLIDGRRIRTPLVNLFHGGVVDQNFVTGRLEIALPGHIREGRHLAIDPDEIVLSKRPFDSSIRNHYRGRIIAIAEEMGRVRITVDAGETFHAMITHQSLDELALRLGESVWVNFKSNAVTIF